MLYRNNCKLTAMHLYARIAVLLCKMCHCQMAILPKLLSFTHGLAGLEWVTLKLWKLFVLFGMAEAKVLSNAHFAFNLVPLCYHICFHHVHSYAMQVMMLHGHMCVRCSVPDNRDLLCMLCFLRYTAFCCSMTHCCLHRLPRCMIDAVMDRWTNPPRPT